MSTLRDTLRKLFTGSPVVKRLPGGRTKVYDVSKSQSVGSPTTYSNRAKWRNGRSFNPTSGYGSGYTNAEVESVRKQMYMDYELMDTEAIISTAIDIVADSCTTVDINGQLLTIKTDNQEVKKILHNLFYDVLNIEFNLWQWIRTMIKYGDCMLYLQIAEEYGVVNVMPIHPSLMIREEGTPEDPDHVRFKYEGEWGYHSMQNYFEAYEVAHFRLLSDVNFLPYGKSYIESSRKLFKALTLMEDAMLIHRIMRAPDRRLYKIEIGNIAPEEVDAYMQNIMAETKKVPLIDQSTGEISLKFNMQNMLEDIYIPVRGGDSGTAVDTLPGLENANQIEDVKYMQEKMFASLQIPKDYLGYGDGTGKANLTSVDINFARTIERIQKIFVSELYKIAVVHLYSQGFKSDDLMSFELTLSNPSLVFERQKTDVLVAKVDLATSIREQNLFSDKYIYENIFGLTEDEWKAERDRIAEDRKFTFRVAQITEEGNDPKTSGKSFGTPHDIASMQVASKFVPGDAEDTKRLYTADEREENEGRPESTESSFETRRDQDFGRDPSGRKENEKTSIPTSTKESLNRIIRGMASMKKNVRQSLSEAPIVEKVQMLKEEQLFDDSEII